MENNCVSLNIKEILELANAKVQKENLILKNSLFVKIKKAITDNFKNENKECIMRISKKEFNYLDSIQDCLKKEDIFVSKKYRVEKVEFLILRRNILCLLKFLMDI